MKASLIVLGLCLLSTVASPATSAESFKELEDAAKQATSNLPGDVAYLATEITADSIKPLFGKNENSGFAIGSSFKLYILGTLAAEVNADRRQFENVMRLKPEWVGPPSSEMGAWPMGSPVTLHTLALKMNTISDNTATDHLLHLLGREAIEKQMAVMEHAHPEWNRPLLSTREMTGLRDKAANMPGRAYAKLDDAAKRKFLKENFGGKPDYEKLDFDAAAYNLSEWFATPLDMAKALAWLKRNSEENQPANPIRGILAAETKLTYDEKIWPYVGFKGGSEDQILCGNWLLKNKNGRWYTFHVYCNSPKEKVEPEKFIKAVQALFAAVQETVDK